MYAGMGCASLGFKKAGFEIAAALEIDPRRCQVYEDNLGFKPITKDVMKVSAKDLLTAANLNGGEKFCVVGCPPCQSFSKLSETSGIDPLSDPRSKYVNKFADLVVEMEPAAVVFENVSWLVKGPGKRFFEKYLRKLEKNGYVTFHRLINAADFGVPQNRIRVVAISIRKKFVNKRTEIELNEFFDTRKKNQKTVKSAIKNLKPLRAGQKDSKDPYHFAREHKTNVMRIIKNIPKNGGSRAQLPRHLWLNCHKNLGHGADSVYGRMSWDKPSPTMTCRCTTPACGRFIHPTQNRGITLREAMRLQTIPDNIKMRLTHQKSSTSYTSHYLVSRQQAEEMVGDAVPVILATKIGKMLLETLP